MQTRRGFLLANAAALSAACAPAAAPTSPQPGTGGAKAEWERQWDDLVAAARGEGQLSITTLVGASYRKALDAFEAAFPGISVDQQTFGTASIMIPKIQQERGASIYSFDVSVFTITSMLSTLKPTGSLDPVRSVIFRPDVLEDKNWISGFDACFMDSEKRWVFAPSGFVGGQWWINTDLVKEGEIKSVRDLLDPKWKGQIVMSDVRVGETINPMTAIRYNMGEDVLKKLLIDQQTSFQRSRVEVAQEMVRGKYAITNAEIKLLLPEYQANGVGKNIKRIVLPETVYLTSQTGVWLFNKPPHPNAAKLFVNWLLSKEGQLIWSKAADENSLRTDVPPNDLETVPDPKSNLVWLQREENIQPQVDTRKFLEELVKQ